MGTGGPSFLVTRTSNRVVSRTLPQPVSNPYLKSVKDRPRFAHARPNARTHRATLPLRDARCTALRKPRGEMDKELLLITAIIVAVILLGIMPLYIGQLPF